VLLEQVQRPLVMVEEEALLLGLQLPESMELPMLILVELLLQEVEMEEMEALLQLLRV